MIATTMVVRTHDHNRNSGSFVSRNSTPICLQIGKSTILEDERIESREQWIDNGGLGR